MSEIENATREWREQLAAEMGCDATNIFPWPRMPRTATVPFRGFLRSTFSIRHEVGAWSPWTWHPLPHGVVYHQAATVDIEWKDGAGPMPQDDDPAIQRDQDHFGAMERKERPGRRWQRVRVVSGGHGGFCDADKDI